MFLSVNINCNLWGLRTRFKTTMECVPESIGEWVRSDLARQRCEEDNGPRRQIESDWRRWMADRWAVGRKWRVRGWKRAASPFVRGLQAPPRSRLSGHTNPKNQHTKIHLNVSVAWTTWITGNEKAVGSTLRRIFSSAREVAIKLIC